MSADFPFYGGTSPEELERQNKDFTDPGRDLGANVGAPAAPEAPKPGQPQQMSPFLKAAMGMRGFGGAPQLAVPSGGDSEGMSPTAQKAADENSQKGTYGSYGASSGDIMSMASSGI